MTNEGAAEHFTILARDSHTRARTGVLHTRRGDVRTPAFMPVGTQAAVKSVTPDEVRSTGSEIILANTYHLMLRPGLEIIQAAGGLHTFMAWPHPILTDSGGFQVYSLAGLREITERGVRFRSHIDGSLHELTPESAITLQLGFGSDIIMPLDDVVGYGSELTRQREAAERTHRWLLRALDYFRTMVDTADPSRPWVFGITQGGFDLDLRRRSCDFVAGLPVDGCAIGGLSVGEPKPVMLAFLEEVAPLLPEDKPRYLMGVGSPEDLWLAVAAGVDLFDCVHPTRVARHGGLYTPEGRVDITNSRFRSHFAPVDETCDCLTCTQFTAAYLHHLFRARELLAYRLATIHNLRFIQREMERIRQSIAEGRFVIELEEFRARYRPADQEAALAQRRRRAGAKSGEGVGDIDE
uniref:Queuine tRNA-ribosyltransferase n=1 Tax=Thermorudis peleae TaxID=1382356 RepID=A0A831TC08_9BACT